MTSATTRPVKLACLACRAAKVRCDGQMPCASRGEGFGLVTIFQSAASTRKNVDINQVDEVVPVEGLLLLQSWLKEELAGWPKRLGANTQNGDFGFHRQNYRHDSRNREPGILQIPYLPPTESIPQLRNSSPENGCSELPTPLHDLGDVVENVLGSMEVPKWSIRAYQCDQDLINAYYIYLHPYLPFLPPPVVPQYEDKFVAVAIQSTSVAPTEMPYWPVSPLALALAGILVLLPVPGESHALQNEARALRRSYADLFARSALDLLEDSIESSSEEDKVKSLRSTLHPAVPRKLEAVYALGILSLYECCQHGNIPKMRIRANQALTTAMDMSLHKGTANGDYSDAQRRCWWVTIFLVYQSSIMTASAPIVTIHDTRITTAFPEFRGCREPWPLLMHAQETLLRSCEVGRQLITEGHHSNLSNSIREEIQTLDSFILELAAEVDRFRCITNYEGPEADASRNLWAITNGLIHTARLMLHRVRAFPDRALLNNDYYDYLAIGISQTSQGVAHDFHLSTGRIAEINALFPFTEKKSIQICLHSALVVCRIFRRLPVPNATRYTDIAEDEIPLPWLSWWPMASPRSIPYLTCCQFQSFGVLAIVLWRVRMASRSGNLASYSYLLDQPGSCSTQVQDAERLIEELQSGMEAMGRSIHADTVFEGVIGMAKEIERIWKSTVMD